MLTPRSASHSVGEKGFVFVTILIILTVLTVLVVANMRWVTLDWKRYSDMKKFQERVIGLEQIADLLGQEFPLCQTHSQTRYTSLATHGDG